MFSKLLITQSLPKYTQVEIPIGDKSDVDKILDVENQDTPEERFLVKFKYCSYHAVEWLDTEALQKLMGRMTRAYLTRFKNKNENASERWSTDEPFNPAYLNVDRIFNSGERGDKIFFLVKWESLGYDQATWEDMETVEKVLLLHLYPARSCKDQGIQ